MKKYLLLLLCLPLLLVTGCKQTPKLENGEEVIVSLNDKQFTTQELYDALKEKYGTSALVTLVDTYITEKEITDEIKASAKEQAKSQYDSYYAYYAKQGNDGWTSFLSQYGYKTGDDFLADLEKNYQQNSILEKYLATTISDDEIKKYYDENIYGEITARHILIKPETTDTSTDEEKATAKTNALNKANELIEKLKTSTDLENDFSNLAKENSADTGSASEGGLIENFTNESGLVKEFWEASLKLENGKYTTTPVETEFGYHIIYKVSQNEKPSLDTVKDKVVSAIVKDLLKAENANYIYWAALREKYGMKINDSTLNDSYQAAMNNVK